MIQEFNDYLDNIKKYTNAGRKPSKPEEILGNDNKIAAFGAFWEKYGRDLQVLAVVKLHEFEMTEAWSKEELSAYIKGIGEVGVFFEKCWSEREQKKATPPEPKA